MMGIRGSEWRKWDFHIHTPYSLLNSRFGINLNNKKENEFDNYIKELFKRALSNNISAIGITDYFFIDGYKEIKLKYINNENKMLELFSEKEYEQIKNIYLFPNIEFRLDQFVNNNSINIHVILSDEIDIDYIEKNFIQRLTFNYGYNNYTLSNKPINKENVEQLGKILFKDNGNDEISREEAIKNGIKNITVNIENIADILYRDEIFNSKYIIAIPPDEDISKICWKGQGQQIRKLLTKISHCFLSSNSNTINWALGKTYDNQEDFINEFGSLKPCIWGSDAHDFDKMFKPDNDRYCWIKSDLSFNGLRQILYEPEERVRIQPKKPEEKDLYRVIDHVIIEDENFSKEPIYFNENLNCIIGGKSTGKSILLNNIAMAVDNEQVENKLNISNNTNNTFKIKNINVYWKDNECSNINNKEKNRKIIYIPQTYLNKLSEEKENDTELDEIIKSILLENENNKNASDKNNDNISILNREIKKLISEYIETYRINMDLHNRLLENGISKDINNQIDSIKNEIIANVDFNTEDEINKISSEYNNLIKDIIEKNSALSELDDDLVYIQTINKIGLDLSFLDYIKRKHIRNNILEKLCILNNYINTEWYKIKENILDEYNNTKKKVKDDLDLKKIKIAELKSILDKNKHIEDLTKKMENEYFKLNISEKLENAIKENKSKLETILDKILNLKSKYYKTLENYINTINKPNSDNLQFDINIIWKSDTFQNYILNIINKKTISKFKDFNLNAINESMYNNSIFLKSLFLNIVEDNNSGIELKNNISKEEALVKIFSNWYNIKYTVIMDNDKIAHMSPGKKALVLLKLMVELSNSEYPILIDQPEDDLDNRSIFNDLVKYIREKKKVRQIITVTHNANIVLGGDTEQIIIANQNSDNSPNDDYRFEYRTGTIENNRPIIEENFYGLVSDSKSKGILYKKDIQTHICEILEGGIKAFEMRHNKYKKTTI